MSSVGDMTADSDSPPSCSQLSSSDEEVRQICLQVPENNVLHRTFKHCSIYALPYDSAALLTLCALPLKKIALI